MTKSGLFSLLEMARYFLYSFTHIFTLYKARACAFLEFHQRIPGWQVWVANADGFYFSWLKLSGHLHKLGAMLDQIPFDANFIPIALYRKHDWNKGRLPLVLALTDGKFGPNVPVGWQNRLMIISQAVWIFYISHQADKKKKQQPISDSV